MPPQEVYQILLHNSGVWLLLLSLNLKTLLHNISSFHLSLTVTLSITVYCPNLSNFEILSSLLHQDRTKFSARILFNSFNAFIYTSSSSVAQYMPNKYSKTYTGTFAPSFIFFVKSFLTTLPAKY